MHGVAYLVDSKRFGHLQLPLLVEGLFFKEEVYFAGRVQEVCVLQAGSRSAAVREALAGQWFVLL